MDAAKLLNPAPSVAELSATQSKPTTITVAMGDGIGPEIMRATLRILDAAHSGIVAEPIEIGANVYAQGHSGGIAPESWSSLRKTGVFLKAPITTPQGGGVKSLNVTLRKTLGLYANVRPCRGYGELFPSLHPEMDLVVVRENEEDLYAGIEHQQTPDVVQCLKLITRAGCERIVRYAFEYAKSRGRRKVTCMTKDNIMKLTDGLFHRVFDELGTEYPEIQKEHWIIDIGMAKVATQPERFDVIVTPNLYGDILSDVAAEVAGSVGLAGSANIGDGFAMFEAIHGSAPDIAGKDVANPSGLLQAAIMMLVHLGKPEVAATIQNAWLRTLEDGVRTQDIAGNSEPVETQAFADAVIARLGQLPQTQPPATYPRSALSIALPKSLKVSPVKETVGVDLFVEHHGSTEDLADQVQALNSSGLKLTMITNRGVKVWPNGAAETLHSDHWRCRFMSEQKSLDLGEIATLQARAAETGLAFIKTEHLCTFDGVPGFSLGQGQ
jgi:isocitrate dehydrogenase